MHLITDNNLPLFRYHSYNWFGGKRECGVQSAECRKCRSVKNEECGKWGVWKMWSVENVECGKCRVWKM